MNPPVESSGHRGPDSELGLAALRESHEFRGPVEPRDDHDHDCDHLALLYESREEQFAAAMPFVRRGLERGERCLYVAAETSREEVLEAMRDHGIDVDDAVDSGALSVHTPSETYRRTGAFDREAMLEFWEDALERARGADGYAGVRAAAEMSWALDGETSLDDLVEYEAVLNSLYEGEEYAVLCQYDRGRFPPEVVEDVIRTHPYLVHGGAASRNVYYTPPEQFFDPEAPGERVDRMLETLHDRTRARAEMRDHERALRRLYETTASDDRSFEETVGRLLDLGRERFDLDVGLLLETEGDQFRVARARGIDLAEGEATLSADPGHYCKQTVTVEAPVGVEDVATVGWDDDPLTREFDLGCYLGTRVTDGTGVYGTVCFADTAPRERSFDDAEYAFLDLMGQWLGRELERRRREAELRRSKRRLERVFESSQDAIFVTDPYADELLEANPAGCEMLGYDREDLLERSPSDFHPDEMDRFRAFVDEVYEEGSGWTDDLTCLHRDGRRLPVEMSASRIDYDGRKCMLAVVRDVSERRERERVQQRLHEIAADPDRPFEEKLQTMFELGCERFDMELGGVASVDPAADRFEVDVTSGEHAHLSPGDRYPLSETYCRATAVRESTCAITQPEAFEGSLCYDRFGVRSYLGTYLEVDGADDRTLWFVSSEPREEEFSTFDRSLLHLMGEWLRYELQHRHDTEQLAALNNLNGIARDIARELARQPTREDIERVVCDRLVAADSYAFAWVGRADERTDGVVPSTTADRHAPDVPAAGDDGDPVRGPPAAALRTGEVQVVQDLAETSDPWRERAGERGVAAAAAVPLVYEAESHGVLTVYTTREDAFDDEEREVIGQLGEMVGLTATAVQREERLELINRLLRHNLLNGLNLVDARLEMLRGRVDYEVNDHLETASERTDDMIDLIETLRALTERLVADDYEREPVDLGRVLGEELDQARSAYGDASIEVRPDLASVPHVLADDLLAEVFDNLLVNAVRHNDADEPRVVVDADVEGETVTVHVADNGPGVPDELRDSVFKKGLKGFESPGSGFGLYLVREIVDSYGGRITVADNEPRGAVFSVTLPRANTDD